MPERRGVDALTGLEAVGGRLALGLGRQRLLRRARDSRLRANLLERGTGRVVITASNSATTTLPSVAPYVSSRHAVVAVAETRQHYLRAVSSDVGVSVVLPGAIRLAMADALCHRPAEHGSASLPGEAVQASRAYLDRFGADPREMADDVLRQALDEGTFCIFTAESDRSVIVAHAEALRDGGLPPVSHGVATEVT